MYALPILTLVGVSVLYYLTSTFISKRRHAQKAVALGCQPPKRRQHRWPLGLDFVKVLVDADKKQMLPNALEEISADVGKNTWIQYTITDDLIITNDPQNLKALLATQFEDFEIGSQRRGNFFPMLGNGIFTSDGKMEHSRAMLRPQFARDQVVDLEAEEVHIQDLMQHLVPKSDSWTDLVDLSPVFFRLTLDSATEFLFGQSVGAQLAALSDDGARQKQPGKLDWTSFGPAFDSATHDLGHRARLADLYYLYNPKSFRDNCTEVHRFADYYVNLALNPGQAREKDPEAGHKKEKYIFLQELVKVTRDPTELRSQLLNILLAGRDTTAGLLGWVFYVLARDPQMFEKLRGEILDQFGTYQHSRNISFASLKSCYYLQHVMAEALRLYPSVPFNSRRAVNDTSLPVGGGPDEKSPIYVRKGMEINYSVRTMHRRKDLWGPDAEEFKPERWVGRKAGWDFLPFNGGPRVCLGQQHALTLAGFTIVRLLQRFDKLENLETETLVKHQYSVTTAPFRVNIRLHEEA